MQTDENVNLREMMKENQSNAAVLAITSGKGGVGKSAIAANLAICLASLQKRILLVDADFSLANLGILMGISSRYNITHFLNGHKSIEEIIHVCPGGVELICGASGFESLAEFSQFERHRLLAELEKFGNDCDVIIIDTGAGINKSVIGFCLASNHVLVVTTPEPTAMTDAYAMIKVLSANNFAGCINLVVNMAESIAEGKKVYRQITEVARRFLDMHVYLAAVLLKDSKLCESVRERTPLVLAYPKSRLTSSLVGMAARLAKNSVISAHQKGFFKKIANWFF